MSESVLAATLKAWRRGELEVVAYGFACGERQMPHFTTDNRHSSSGAWAKLQRRTTKEQGEQDG